MPDPNSLLQDELAAAVACDDCLMRMETTCALVGLRRRHIANLVTSGAFPAPVRLSKRVVRWHAGSVRRWIAEQVAAAT